MEGEIKEKLDEYKREIAREACSNAWEEEEEEKNNE